MCKYGVGWGGGGGGGGVDFKRGFFEGGCKVVARQALKEEGKGKTRSAIGGEGRERLQRRYCIVFFVFYLINSN